MHEIITIQLGQRSNYLATHFWNLQESYFTYSDQTTSIVDHDVHFRAGVGVDGTETYTPRTVIYDLKGGFGSLRKINALYAIEDPADQAQGLWDGNASIQTLSPITTSKYQQQLEQGLPTSQLHDVDVRYWSDFNRVFYHPRSIIQLNEYELNSQILPFENWSAGQDFFRSLDRDADLIDRDVRPFVEDCDQMQGMQLFCGSDDAWGGFASEYLEALRDEYGKTSLWVFGLADGRRTTSVRNTTRLTNIAQSLRSMATQASMYTNLYMPPSRLPPYLTVASSSEWQCSALLCSALETATLPTRLRRSVSRGASLTTFEDMVKTNNAHNIFQLQASYHIVPEEAVQLREPLDTSRSSGFSAAQTANIGTERVDSFTEDFDLNCSEGQLNATNDRKYVFAQVECRRRPGTASQSTMMSASLAGAKNMDDETVVEVYDVHQPFPLLDSFPDSLLHRQHPADTVQVSAGILSTSTTKDQLVALRNATHRWITTDEREAFYHDLTSIAEEYSHGWDSGSDSDDDNS